MPAQAGIQNYLLRLDSRLHGNDAKGSFETLYECAKYMKIKRRIVRQLCQSLDSGP